MWVNKIFPTAFHFKNINKKESKGERNQAKGTVCGTEDYIQMQKLKSILKICFNDD